MCNWILRVEAEHFIHSKAETCRLGAKVDGIVGCDKEATCSHAEPHKQAMHLNRRTLRRPRAQGRGSQTHETSRRSCQHQKPCRSSRGRRRQRTQHSEITRDAPAGPTRGRLQCRKKDNETKHRRGSQTTQCRQARDHPRRKGISQGQPKKPRNR